MKIWWWSCRTGLNQTPLTFQTLTFQSHGSTWILFDMKCYASEFKSKPLSVFKKSYLHSHCSCCSLFSVFILLQCWVVTLLSFSTSCEYESSAAARLSPECKHSWQKEHCTAPCWWRPTITTPQWNTKIQQQHDPRSLWLMRISSNLKVQQD